MKKILCMVVLAFVNVAVFSQAQHLFAKAHLKRLLLAFRLFSVNNARTE